MTEVDPCYEFLTKFAESVGSHGNTMEFNEKLYLLTLLAMELGRKPSTLFKKAYCPKDIVTYYWGKKDRTKLLDEYSFDNFDADDSAFGSYVDLTIRELDNVLERFINAKFSRKLRSQTERVKWTAWAHAVTPHKTNTVHKMDSLSNTELHNSFDAKDRIHFKKAIVKMANL